MTRGEEETSTSQAGRKRGPARGTRFASNTVSSLTMEELRTYCEIPDNIDLKLMEKPDKSTLGGEHNAVLFTREQLAVGLRFPVPALVKQFLHFTGAPLMSLKVIHFQSIFLIYFYLKILIYVQKYGITNQTVMQQGIQEKEIFCRKKSSRWMSITDITG